MLASTRSRRRAAPAPLIEEFDAALADDLDTPERCGRFAPRSGEKDAAAAGWMLGILVGTASLT